MSDADNFTHALQTQLDGLHLDGAIAHVVELAHPTEFVSAVGRRARRRALILELRASGVSGFGEAGCRSDPYYSHEFVDGAVLVLQQFVFDQLPAVNRWRELLRRCSRVRGWPFSRAAVTEALVDLVWRSTGVDVLVQCTKTEPIDRIAAGISLGIFDDAGLLGETIAAALEEGFRRVKLKIDAHVHPQYVTEIRSRFPEVALGFDGNGSLSIDQNRPLFHALRDVEPKFVEQPFHPRDLRSSALLRRELGLRICLDETIEDRHDVTTAVTALAVDEVNLKIGRVGGPDAALDVAAECRAQSVPLWMGGMFETGIGRAAALRLASLVRPDFASDLGPSRRYYDNDIVDPPIEMSPSGYTLVPTRPVGVQMRNAAAHDEVTLHA